MIRAALILSAACFIFGCSQNGATSNDAANSNAHERSASPVSVPSASATPVEKETSKEVPKDLLIKVSRGPCYGTCPQYSMSIKADGSVEFDGEKFTETVGKAAGKIETDDVLRIYNKFEKIGFAELNDEYSIKNCPTAATDMPTVNISLTADGKTKSVSHYTGCVENDEKHTPHPVGLSDLENKIQDIAESKGWIK